MSTIQPIADQHQAFMADSIDLLTRQRAGHTGRWTYDENWAEFVSNNPFYHVFNEDCGLFALNAETIARRAGHLRVAVDFGAGSREAFVRKLLLVLARMRKLDELISIDLNDAFPAATAEVAGRWLPKVQLTQLTTDFSVNTPVLNQPVLAFYVGSSISNIILNNDETLTEGLTRNLNRFAEALPPGSILMLSYDRCQDKGKIFRAYNHPAFEKMERGLIGRMNRELGLTGVSENDFALACQWYPAEHLFSNELQALRTAPFMLGGVNGLVREGGTFWSGSCYKPIDPIMNDALSPTPLTPIEHFDAPNMRLLMLERR